MSIVAWTAGWIKMPLGTEVGLGPGHVVLDGEPAPPPQRGTAPNFRLIFVVSKCLDGSRWHLRCHLVGSPMDIVLGPSFPLPEKGVGSP